MDDILDCSDLEYTISLWAVRQLSDEKRQQTLAKRAFI
jgi:hypothetical protein